MPTDVEKPWASPFISGEMDERPPVGERGEEPIPKSRTFVDAVLNIVRNVRGRAPFGPEPIYPKNQKPSWPYPTAAPEVAEIQAPEGAKQLLGFLLADAGVKVQPKFLESLAGVKVAPGTYGSGWKGGGYSSQAGIGLPGLEPSAAIGWPGPDYQEYDPRSGFVFLHEALHRWDETLPKGERDRIWKTMLRHFDETNPAEAAWLRATAAGKNPTRPPSEPFTDAMTNYLLYHEKWSDEEMDKLMKDYFKFTIVPPLTPGPSHVPGMT